MPDQEVWPEDAVFSQDYTKTSVVIVGAGIGGMCIAIDMIRQNKCQDFVILEKSGGVGGTWHDNTYPGCAVDLQSIVYSYSFAPNSHWSRDFPGQKEILAYLTKVAQEYKLYDHIRFASTVEETRWDDKSQQWKTKVKVAPGTEAISEYTLSSAFFVSAVGQLSQPLYPNISGADKFQGKSMHSARWDWTYDLKDKKIAVIGSGCSAVQIIPEVAKVAKQVTVFQRSPHWICPRGDYEIPEVRKLLYRYFPFWQRHWRRRFIDGNETEYISNNFTKRDENADLTKVALDMMHEQLPNRQDLWEKLTPKFPLGCKRVVVSDFYFPALARSNVKLEARPIHNMTEHGINIVNAEGKPEATAEFDLIVYATGFRAQDFLHPMKVYGRNGRSLEDVWRKNGAEAYLGIGINDMPNLGLVLGPNTGLLHNSFILMIEAQSRYINGLIKPVLEAKKSGGSLSLRPQPKKLEEYNEQLQMRLKDFAANDSRCTNWYKAGTGRITNLWPGTVLEYQHVMEKVDYSDYIAEGSCTNIVKDRSSQHVGRVQEEGGFLEKVSSGSLAMVSTGAFLAAGFLMRTLLAAQFP